MEDLAGPRLVEQSVPLIAASTRSLPIEWLCVVHQRLTVCSSPDFAMWMEAEPLDERGMGTGETRHLIGFYISHFKIQKRGRACVYIRLSYLPVEELNKTFAPNPWIPGHCRMQPSLRIEKHAYHPAILYQGRHFVMEKRCVKAWKCLMAKRRIICLTFTKIRKERTG